MSKENGFEGLFKDEKHEILIFEVASFVSEIIHSFKPDMIVKVHRKGDRIFGDLLFHGRIQVDSNIPCIVNADLDSYKGDYSRVLILDDSIKTGRTIKSVVESIRERYVCQVKVASIVSNRYVVDELKRIHMDVSVMIIYEDESSQNDSSIIFTLLNKVGLKKGVGYPFVKMDFDVCEYDFLKRVVDEAVASCFGQYEYYDECFENGVKWRYVLSDLCKEDVGTTDQKMFLLLDSEGSRATMILEFIVNPPQTLLVGARDVGDVYAIQEDYLRPFMIRMMEYIDSKLSEKDVSVYVKSINPSIEHKRL